MSESIQFATLPLGAYNGATELPLWHLPTDLGGITILEAWMVSNAAGTAITGQVVKMSDVATGGTPAINGTVGAFAGTIVAAAGVVHKLTISNAWVDDGAWLGYDQASGTVAAGSYIQLAFVQGRGSS